MSRASWLGAIACALFAFGAIPSGSRCALSVPSAWGQNIGDRTVSGTILNESSQPVVGATVFLKNEKTKAIRSYISTAEGHFRFSQVDMSVDFDLWAENNGKKSAIKTVSSWDDRKDFISDLKLK
ncbi:MAG: carboxypeptidase-like regulatory domain-containing protein [Terracidiphilus sp.]